MEQNIYLSYKEFLDNYDKDLKQWLDVYEEGSEEDFILELRDFYKDRGQKIEKAVSFGIGTEILYDDGTRGEVKDVGFKDYFLIMECKLRDYICKENNINQSDCKGSISENNINVMDYWERVNWAVERVSGSYYRDVVFSNNIKDYYASILFDYWIHNILKIFFNYELDDYWGVILHFDEVKYKNFQLSIPKILKFLDERMQGLRAIKTTIITPLISEEKILDFSDEKTKVKLIVLEKLGVIDYIKSIQQDEKNVNQTAGILSLIMGCKKDILYSYIRPMLQGYRDDEDKNSPYKNKKNVTDADKVIHKLKLKPDFDN